MDSFTLNTSSVLTFISESYYFTEGSSEEFRALAWLFGELKSHSHNASWDSKVVFAWHHCPLFPPIPAVLYRNMSTSLSFTSVLTLSLSICSCHLCFLLSGLRVTEKSQKKLRNNREPQIKSEFLDSIHRGGKPSHVRCFNWSYVGQSIWLHIKQPL